MVLALACGAGAGRADDAHHRNNLLGDRALGTGGAWTGLADDPSAAYYNPAGLGIVSRRSLSASMQLNGFEHVEIDSALEGISDEDFVFDQRVTIPVFVSAALKFGPRDANDFQQHAFAFSTFHPSNRSLRFALSLRAPGEGDVVMRYEDISVIDEDKTVWIGPSYSFAFSPLHALGISVFWSDRSLVHTESRAREDEGMGDEVVGNTEYFVVRRTIAELDAQHVVVRLGWVYQLLPSLRIGLMFQPPGIPISAKSSRQYRRVGTSEDGMGVFHKTIEAEDLPADSPIPWEVRLGVGINISSVTRLDFDAALTGPNGSEDDPVELFGTGGRDDLEPPGVLMAEKFYRLLTPNFNLGVETMISDVVILRGGVFTDLSAVPDVHAGDTYQLSDISRFGASMSVGLRFGDVDMTFGGFIRWGRGETLGIDTREGAENFYVPHDLEDRTIAFFITGQLSSAKKLLGGAAKGVFGSDAEPTEKPKEKEKPGEPAQTAPPASTLTPAMPPRADRTRS
ncbi:MAG TPA: hypothetical protein VJV78_29700 [Polyangiales bacterium]|nr:hypothetical protein [Polyangiales bacterium]